MKDGITAPVAAGLSTGIAIIVIFAMIFNSAANPNVSHTTTHLNLAIEGSKDTYRAGEPISFTLKVSGYGYYCQTPNAAIWNASSAFASVPVGRSGLPTPICPTIPQPHSLNDTYSWNQERSAVIEEAGDYVLGARVGNDPPVQKEFRVIR